MRSTFANAMVAKPLNRALALLMLLGAALPVAAQTVVDDAWVRATVPHQASTGAFMKVTASSDSTLLRVESPAAKTVQIHQSQMKNDVMSMQPVSSIALPAGKTVMLEPASYHVMLIDLVKQVKEGDEVPLTLVVEDAKGQQERINVVAPARALNMPDHDHMPDHAHMSGHMHME
ncbi:transporter [Pseudomonas laurentiana]|nr:transporter [Pseudomonas laurentiana]